MKVERGKKGAALAFVVVVMVPLLLSLMFYPTAHMELKNLPFGVLSLDEGAATPMGEQNLGAMLADKVESGGLAEMLAGADGADASAGAATGSSAGAAAGSDTDPAAASGASDQGSAALSSALAFEVFDSQEALDEAFDNNELYGAIVIPEDFSELQMKALMAKQAAATASAANPAALAALAGGADEAAASSAASVETPKPTISIVIDYAKSPLVASQMSAGMGSMLGSDAVNVEVETINQGPAADSASNGNIMAGVLSQMVVIMPLLICSLVAGTYAVMALKVRGGETAAARARRYGLSLTVNAGTSLILSGMLYGVITCVAGLAVDAVPFVLYCWAVSFLLMMFFGGLACIRGRLALVAGATVLLLGMTSAYLPLKALPAFWQDWVVPWVPEPFMGNGLRAVVFAGGNVWNEGTMVAGIYALVGLCFAAVGVGLGNKVAAPRASRKA